MERELEAQIERFLDAGAARPDPFRLAPSRRRLCPGRRSRAGRGAAARRARAQPGRRRPRPRPQRRAAARPTTSSASPAPTRTGRRRARSSACATLPDGVSEFMTHPGWFDDDLAYSRYGRQREVELVGGRQRRPRAPRPRPWASASALRRPGHRGRMWWPGRRRGRHHDRGRGGHARGRGADRRARADPRAGGRARARTHDRGVDRGRPAAARRARRRGRGHRRRACPGSSTPVSGRVGEEAHHVPELRNQPLAARLAERFGLPVFVDNDVNALALAELTFGLGRGVAVARGAGPGHGLRGRRHPGRPARARGSPGSEGSSVTRR